MGSLSLPRPLLGALVAVFAFAAVWMVALRPHAATQTSAAPQPVTTPAAHPPVHPADARPPLPPTRTNRAAAPKASAAVTPRAAHRPAADRAARPHRVAPAHRAHETAALAITDDNHTVAAVDSALAADKVVALLIANPRGVDDRADAAELAGLSNHGGQVVKIAAAVSLTSRLSAITTNIQVTSTPTLIVIDRHHEARTITGYADPLEYGQAVAAALAARK